MRILFTRFPLESTHGGAEIQLLSLMGGLKKHGHDVEFLGSCKVLLNEAPKIGVRTTALDIGKPPVTKLGAVTFAWRRTVMRKRLTDAVANRQPDAVFMVSLSEKVLLTEYLASQGAKVFWIEHDRVGNWLRKNPWLSSLKKASRHATIITVSELSRQIFLELGFDEHRVIAISNGIDLHRFSLPATRSPLPAGGIHLGCISRVHPEKGVDLLLQSVLDLPEVSLSIVGKGRDEGLIRTIIAERERMEGVSRFSLVRSADLNDFYASIDALALPSRDNDPFGLVAAEAMALGIPVIVTDQCGIAGYLKDGVDALIVAANDERAMADGVRRLMDPELRERLAMNGMKMAREKFAVEKMIDGYEKILTKEK